MVLHALKLWGGMTDAYKLYWYWGWAEGLAVGKGEKATLFIGCLESIGAKIAIGTIDRFCEDSDEQMRTKLPLSVAATLALTHKAAPCEGTDPSI